MSKQLDTGTQKAYRAVIDQNQKNIEQLEKQLPWIPTLHKKRMAYDLLTVFCAVTSGVLLCWFLAREGG